MAATIEHRIRAAGHVFTFPDVPVERCDACGEVRLHGIVLERMDLWIADELARAGANTPAALRFMRKALGLRAADLAELLEVAPETLSRWENGKQEIDHRALALVGALVADKLHRRETVLERLRALKTPRKLKASVVMRGDIEPAPT
jgi:DNA-binding transcriptional regulator YiaG